jgi:hypothetical protein
LIEKLILSDCAIAKDLFHYEQQSAAAAAAAAAPGDPPLSFLRQLQELQDKAIRFGEQGLVDGERMIREGTLKKIEAEVDLASAGRMYGTDTGSIVECGGGAAVPRIVKPNTFAARESDSSLAGPSPPSPR